MGNWLVRIDEVNLGSRAMCSNASRSRQDVLVSSDDSNSAQTRRGCGTGPPVPARQIRGFRPRLVRDIASPQLEGRTGGRVMHKARESWPKEKMGMCKFESGTTEFSARYRQRSKGRRCFRSSDTVVAIDERYYFVAYQGDYFRNSQAAMDVRKRSKKRGAKD
jgi:hypothetical protein